MKRLVITSLAALAAIGMVGVPVASADPGQNCQSEWNLMYNVPIGVARPASTQTAAITCAHPSGRTAKDRGRAGTIRLPLRWRDSPHSAPGAGNAASTAASTITRQQTSTR